MATANDDLDKFSTPEKIFEICSNIQRLEDLRALDRAQINVLFNGSRPYSAEEEKKYNIQINVNWGFGKNIIRDANTQLNSATLHTGQLFTATCQKGQVDKRDEWSNYFTKNIHEPIQNGRSGAKHYWAVKEQNANTSLHGIGILLWGTDFNWMPRFVPLEDIGIPTDTYCDFTNLSYFYVNLYLTMGEFVDLTQRKDSVKGWNKEFIAKILDTVNEMPAGEQNGLNMWRDRPEAAAEVFKQNGGWIYSDAAPKVKCRLFFYRNRKNPNQWHRHIILREEMENVEESKEQFIYDGSETVFATGIEHILSVQYGDGNFVAPFKFHCVRGIGVDLFAAVETLNRVQCETVQHTLEQLKMMFRITDPADKARLKQVVLDGLGFIPEGLSIVKKEERHQIDPNIVTMAMSLIRQNMQEASSSYVPNVNDGTEKEMTAFEARARLNQANVMVSGMLQSIDLQKGFYWEEIVRRFLDKNSGDEEVKAFRKKCIEDGIPEELLVPENWKVRTNRVLGSGDKTLAQAQAMWLWKNKTDFDPAEQRKIKRQVVTTMLDDPAKGVEFVPDAPATTTAGSLLAEQLFGTLMTGNPCDTGSGYDQIGYVEKMLQMTTNKVQQITQTDNIGTMEDVIGLSTVLQNIEQHVQIIAGDEMENQRVKMYGDAIGKLGNLVKAFGQRVAAQNKSNAPKLIESVTFKDLVSGGYADAAGALLQSAGLPPNQSPQGDVKTAKAVQQLHNNQAKFEQKTAHSQIAFELEQIRKLTAHQTDLSIEQQKANQELVHQHASKLHELMPAAQQPKENAGQIEQTG